MARATTGPRPRRNGSRGGLRRVVAEGLVHAMAGIVFVPCIIYNVDNIMRLWTGLVSLSLFGSSFPFFSRKCTAIPVTVDEMFSPRHLSSRMRSWLRVNSGCRNHQSRVRRALQTESRSGVPEPHSNYIHQLSALQQTSTAWVKSSARQDISVTAASASLNLNEQFARQQTTNHPGQKAGWLLLIITKQQSS